MWDYDKAQPMEHLLHPCSLARFASEYHERAPLYIRRCDPGYYRSIFSLDELERFLYGVEIAASYLQMVKDGAPLPAAAYARTISQSDPNGGKQPAQIVDAERVSDLFAMGYTLHFDHIRSYSPPAAAFCRALEAFFRHRVRATAFLTPPRNAGFAVHYDTYDAFILQISGCKQWRAYEPRTLLPLESQPYRPSDAPEHPVLEVELQPGDLLYLPRGTYHEARANGDEPSLHLSVIPDAVRWQGVFERVLAEAGPDELLLRKNTTSSLDERDVAALVARVFSPERLQAARDAIEAEFCSTRRNDANGRLGQLLAAPSITPMTPVRMRDDMLYDLTETDTHAVLRFSAKELRLPKAAAAIIREVAARGSLPVGAFLLFDKNAVAIVRGLVQAGFLLAATPPPRKRGEPISDQAVSNVAT